MLIETNKSDLAIANTAYTLGNNNYEVLPHSLSDKKDLPQKEESNTSNDSSENFDFVFFSSEIKDDQQLNKVRRMQLIKNEMQMKIN